MDDAKVKAVRRENEIGLLIAAADLGLFCLANSCLLGLRHRMQVGEKVPRFYTGVPVVEILKIDWKHLGPSQFLFGGTPASLAFLILDLGRNYLIRSLYNGFTRRVIWKVRSRKRRHQIRWIMDITENILKGVAFAIIAPLEIFATLQRLGLIPSWPVYSQLLALIPLMPLSPVQTENPLSGFGLGWCGQFLGSLLVSPLSLWLILFYGKIEVDKRLYAYLRLVLLKPDNPDAFSIKGALDDELDNDTIPGLGFIKHYDGMPALEGTLLDELKKEVIDLYERLRRLVNISKWGENREYEEEENSDFEGNPPILLRSSDLLSHSAAEVPPLPTNGNDPRPAPSNRDSPILDSQVENHNPASDIFPLPQHRSAGAVSPSRNFSSSPALPLNPETIVPPSPTNVTPTETPHPSNHPSSGLRGGRPSLRDINNHQAITDQIFPHRHGPSAYLSAQSLYPYL
ncbi:hypothetical protein MMC07_002976 [Pseudocyphellaria aurata]|nr:hypothetical protein [Pseudocyphellaria aurata]